MSQRNDNETAKQSINEQHSRNQQQQTKTTQLQHKKHQQQPKEQQQHHKQKQKESLTHCDILLNNFKISKKSYRVLLNGEHVVWERLHAKSGNARPEKQQQQQIPQQPQPAKVEESDNEHEPEPIATTAAASVGATIQPNAAACGVPTYGSKSQVLHIDEIVGVRRATTRQATLKPRPHSESDESTAKPTAQYLSIHYAERILKSATDCNRWHIRQLTLFNADPYIVRQWHQALSAKLEAQTTRLRIRRLLVFINPYGGRRQGLQMYERYCKPIFQMAEVDASCIISQRANQIRDILMTHDLRVFDAVCCVGGDGTVAEVINGLLFRTMRELGLDEQRPAYVPKPMLPVGVIPAGSTDTIAYSMHGTSDVRTAAIHVILGQRRGLDISSVRNSRCLLRFCASILSYGYLGDVAANSEQYRWMGTKRYDYTGVKAFISNRGYNAEIRVLVDEYENDFGSVTQRLSSSAISGGGIQAATSTTSISESSICYANCQRCSVATSIQNCLTSEQPQALYNAVETDDVDLKEDAEMLSSDKLRTLNLSYKKQESEADILSTSPPTPSSTSIKTQLSMEEPEPSFSSNSVSNTNSRSTRGRWQTITGNFFMICGANITCACARSPNGISRYSHLGDGYLDLILVRRTSLFNNVRFLLNTARRDGDISNLPFVEVYRTRKFHFGIPQATNRDEPYNISGSCQPISESYTRIDTQESTWNCDGEVVNDLDITMTSHCQLIDVLMRGPYSYTKVQQQCTQAAITNSVFCCCRD